MQNGIYIPNQHVSPIVGNVTIEVRDAKTGRLKAIEHYHNMFVTAGKNSLADHLKGTTANNKGIITYSALGTGITAPALADTQLQTEIVRKLISVREVNGKTAVFQTYFNPSEGNGTLKEAGLFGDAASGTANSGTLFCRVAINRTKSASDTLTLYWNVTIG